MKAQRILRSNSKHKSSKKSPTSSWYFIRLAFLAIPQKLSGKKQVKGTLFKQYHLVEARNIKSAFKKADYILSFSEHLDAGGRLNGKPVIFKKVGILDVEPLYEPLQNGCEIFDESELNIKFADVQKWVIPRSKRQQMIAYEKKHGKTNPIEVILGDEFSAL